MKKIQLMFMFLFLLFAGLLSAQEIVLVSEPDDGAQTRRVNTPEYVRGMHVSMWAAGSKSLNDAIVALVEETEFNTMVITVKEVDGKIALPGIKEAAKYKYNVRPVRDWKTYLDSLKEKGIYTVARMCVFKDNAAASAMPELAIKNPEGGVWLDAARGAWFDPYNKKSWEYAISIALKAAELGFDEIQFDYIRFPADGKLKDCRYSNPTNNAKERVKALTGFLKEASARLKQQYPHIKISVDTYGLTTTDPGDMGIGQRIEEMAKYVDYVSPMVYPSHYYKGTYGIAEPNKSPYAVAYIGLEGGAARVPAEKLRPWYQDFSLYGVTYDAQKVRAQIQAGYDTGVGSWLLWSPSCKYTKAALKGPDEEDTFEKSKPPTALMVKTNNRRATERKIKEEIDQIRLMEEYKKM
jgi:hypothetical protein